MRIRKKYLSVAYEPDKEYFAKLYPAHPMIEGLNDRRAFLKKGSVRVNIAPTKKTHAEVMRAIIAIWPTYWLS